MGHSFFVGIDWQALPDRKLEDFILFWEGIAHSN